MEIEKQMPALQLGNNVYTLDRKDRIVLITGPWDQFAQENDGESMCACHVLGRPIWDFISGDVTRMWLYAIVQRVRASKMAREYPYRCDSAKLKRYMQMRASIDDVGAIRLEHELIKVEQRTTPVHIRPWTQGQNQEPMIRCSVCGYIKTASVWKEPQATLDGSTLIVRYTVCDTCSQFL